MTLTQASVFTKRGLIIFAVLIFLLISGKLSYDFWYKNIYLPSLPKLEEQPEKKFGTLPPLLINPNKKIPANLVFKLDTTTGGLPQTPKLLRVYFIPQSGFSLLAPDRAKSLAAQLGFSIGPQSLSETQYKFTDSLGGNITIDLISANFEFDRPVATSSAQASAGPLPAAATIEKEFRKYLSDKALLTTALANGRAKVIFNGQSQIAETAEVSVWPEDVDKLPIMTDSNTKGLVSALVTKNLSETDKYIKLVYNFWPVDLTTFSTYPLLTPSQALDNLKFGNGFLLTPPTQKTTISITSVYLGYFQSREYSPYLQPVYVFEGPDLVAITPALVPN